MREPLFLDSSGWLAALLPGESRHAEARSLYQAAAAEGSRIVTTDLVMAEMYALLLRERGGVAALAFLERLQGDPTHEVVYCSAELEREATDRWLRPYRDQPFSLADAVSFEVMRRERISRALTLDRHFAAAGYRAL